MHLKKTIILLIVLFGSCAYAQQDFSKVEIKTLAVAQNIYMMMGAGGNLGLCTGDNGPFLIDDQYAPLTVKILSAISKITDQPVKFLINTHWHSDHTGGNENIGKSDTIIVAHENVRKRMSTGQMMKVFNSKVPPASAHALPVVTFPTSLSFHWNDETIEAIHFPRAHTDGDAAIFFKKANVIHTGDLFFNGIYPFVDAESGGALVGMIQSVEKIIEKADTATKIIPGHGPLATKTDLEAYNDMLKTVHKRISKLLNDGKSVEEIVASKPTADFDPKWGKGFLSPDKWVTILCSVIAP
ncbi:MAG: MBL fold metallo-hydrolase [Proteobacteria bacterium]|nr:MBL fold metallo-hydrolase [Desulfobacula sp.]MBU3953956.1 MBL fold metallo-hydrolase [Pseudomonadota bacterium]MBU4130906.1 MBL fold metallo-hydrolase [Pseudomonadota bacterium]